MINVILSLSNLIMDLNSHGFMHAAKDISEILHNFVIEDDEEDKENTDNEEGVVNINGLRGDVIPEQPMGGLSIEPFFFDPGNLT